MLLSLLYAVVKLPCEVEHVAIVSIHSRLHILEPTILLCFFHFLLKPIEGGLELSPMRVQLGNEGENKCLLGWKGVVIYATV